MKHAHDNPDAPGAEATMDALEPHAEEPDLSILPHRLEKQALYWKARAEGDRWAVDRAQSARHLLPYRALVVAVGALNKIRTISPAMGDLHIACDALRQIEEMGK